MPKLVEKVHVSISGEDSLWESKTLQRDSVETPSSTKLSPSTPELVCLFVFFVVVFLVCSLLVCLFVGQFGGSD